MTATRCSPRIDEHGPDRRPTTTAPARSSPPAPCEQLQALRRRPAGEGPADPAERGRRLPHRAHGSPPSATWPTLARSVSTHDPRTPLISNRDGQVVHDGREVLRPDRRPDRQPGALGPLHGDDGRPRRHRHPRDAAGRHPHRHRQAGAQGRRDVRAQDARPARRRPRVLRQARRGLGDRRPRRPGGWSSPPPRAPSTAPRRPPAPTMLEPGAADRRGRQPPRQDRASRAAHGGQVVEWLVEDGDLVSPGQPLRPTAPRGRQPDGHHRERHRRAARRASSASAPTGRPGWSPTPRSSTRIDSSDEWIQQRSGIKQRRWATARGDRPDDVGRGRRAQALEHAGIDARQIDCVIVATVTHLLQTPAIATAIAYELGTDQAAAFDISAACAGFCHGVALADRHGARRQRRLRPGDRRRAALRPHRRRRPRHGVHLRRRRRRRGRRPERDPGHRPGGVGLRRRAVRPDPAEGGLARRRSRSGEARCMPHLVMQGNPVFRWASFAMAKIGQQALDRAGITVDDLDVLRAPPGQHAHHRRDGPRR